MWCLSLHAVADGLYLGWAPVAGESGLAQDSLRRAVAAVWRACGLASPACCFPHVPHTTLWVIICWRSGGVDSWARPPYLLSGGSLLAEVGFPDKAQVVSRGLNTALVPICYLDKWLFANVFLGTER